MAKQSVTEVIALLDKMRKIARKARRVAREQKDSADCCEKVAPYYHKIADLAKGIDLADGVDWSR